MHHEGLQRAHLFQLPKVDKKKQKTDGGLEVAIDVCRCILCAHVCLLLLHMTGSSSHDYV